MLATHALRQARAILAALICILPLTACGEAGAPQKSNYDLFMEAAANMRALKSYHIEGGYEYGEVQFTLEGDVDAANDRYQLDVTSAGKTERFISVDGKHYRSTDAGKTFNESPEGPLLQSEITSLLGIWEEPWFTGYERTDKTFKDGKPLTEKIGVVQTRHISVNLADLEVSPTPTGMPEIILASSPTMTGSVDIWVSTGKKPQIHQLKAMGIPDGRQSNGEIRWSKFDEPVDIKAPSTASDEPASSGDPSTMDNAELLKRAAANMRKLKSYHIDVAGEAGGQSLTMTGEIETQGDLRLAIDASGQQISVISAAQAIYIRTHAAQSYQTLPKAATGTFLEGLKQFTDMWLRLEPAEVDHAKFRLRTADPSTELINGIKTKHISANAQDLKSLSMVSENSSAVEGTIDLWVALDRPFFVHKMEMKGTSEGSDIHLVITWSRFNEQFNIEAPPENSLPDTYPDRSTPGAEPSATTSNPTP